MGYNAAPLERLIEQFAKLPGIGRKGATRLAYQVLSMDKEEALDFARAIEEAHTKIHRCRVCQNFTEDEICAICTGEARDHSVICVVESSSDQLHVAMRTNFLKKFVALRLNLFTQKKLLKINL